MRKSGFNNLTIYVKDFEDSQHPIDSGAFISLFERGDSPVGRMCFFDSDYPRKIEQLKAFHRALGFAIESLEKGSKDSQDSQDSQDTQDTQDTKEILDIETLQDLLGLIMRKEEIPSQAVLKLLSPEQKEQISLWCASLALEASDNDFATEPMPSCLRDFLPENHTYKTWRVKN